MNPSQRYSAYIAIMGRPNVGKSTLMNAQVAEKVSIVSPRPQTTRQRIVGVFSEEHYQMIYVDTPGYHRREEHTTRSLNQYLNDEAKAALIDEGLDIILWVVEALCWTVEDDNMLALLKNTDKPLILVVNKIDLVKEKKELLAYLQSCQEKTQSLSSLKEVLLISAQEKEALPKLNSVLKKYMLPGPFYFDTESSTNRSKTFRIAEIIREKAMLCLREELPYAVAVTIQHQEYQGDCCHIHAIVWVERESQKGMIIGKNGEQLRTIGTLARKEMSYLFKEKYMLRLWVKVKEKWSKTADHLKSLGYYE